MRSTAWRGCPKRTAIVICIAVLVGGLCAPQVAGAKYVVATDAPFFPFEMQSPGGEFFGFDLDVIRAIAVVAGFGVEIRNITFDAIIGSVASGKADLGVAGLTITEERETVTDFSAPYCVVNQSVLVRKDSGLNIATALGGRGPNKAVGAVMGTTGFAWVESNLQHNGVDVQLKGYDTWDLAVLDLLNRRIDALVCDEFVLPVSLADHSDDLTVAGILNTNEYFGFLVAERDPKGILPGINAAMVTLGLQVINRAGGGKGIVVTPGSVWDNLLKAYFGPKPEKIEAAWLAAKGLLFKARDLPGVAAFASKLAELATGRRSNQLPSVAFTWQVLASSGARVSVEPRTGDEIRFDASSSSDPDGTIASYEWDWETDGTFETTGTTPTTEHTFSSSGSHRVTLRVTDNEGATGQITKTITVGSKQPPVADFTLSPASPSTSDKVQFSDESSDPDGAVTAWEWEFGDGATSTEQAPTHQYLTPGTFTVRLTASDTDGLTGTKETQVVVVAPPSSGPPRFQEQWGLVIGVGEYADPAIADLQFTEADARAFYGFLTNPRGGGFAKDHVRFLLNEEATTASVKAAFRWLIGQAGAEDLVVIYFAGHGGTGEDLTKPPDETDGIDEYLVTYDTQQDLFSTAVRDDEMADWLASFRSEHVVLVLDCCFAAGATRSLEQVGTRAGPGNRVFNDLTGPGRLFLAASQEAELSYEDAALGHGVFTYYLLRGLGSLEGMTSLEADADKDGRVTVEELRTYLEREVSKQRPQHPLVTGDLALTRVALSGYGVPLAGEVTALQGEYVIISLGMRHGVQVGDRFEVIRSYTLPDGSSAIELRAVIEVTSILGPDRSMCKVLQSIFPIETKDAVRPAE